MYARKTTFVTKKSKEDKTRVAKVSKNGLQVGKSRKNNLKTPNKPIAGTKKAANAQITLTAYQKDSCPDILLS